MKKKKKDGILGEEFVCGLKVMYSSSATVTQVTETSYGMSDIVRNFWSWC